MNLMKLFWLAIYLFSSIFCTNLEANSKEYHRILASFPKELYPPRADYSVANQIEVNTSERLVVFEDGEIKPAIAESWSFAPDALSVEFVMRTGAKFSDGSPIKCENAVSMIKRNLRKDSLRAKDLFWIEGAPSFYEGKNRELAGVQCVKSDRLLIKLTKPFPYLLTILTGLSFSILPESSYVALEKQSVPFVGSGPFFLSLIDEKSELLVLTKNPYYWDESKVYLDKIIYHITQTEVKARDLFAKAKVHDIIPFEPDPNLKGISTQKIHFYTICVFYLGLNMKNKPLDNIKIRRLIRNNVDKTALIKDSGLPEHYEAIGYIPRGALGFRDDRLADKATKDDLDRCNKHCELDVIYPIKYQRNVPLLFDKLRKKGFIFHFFALEYSAFVTRFFSGKYDIAYVGSNPEMGDPFYMLRYLTDDHFYPGIDNKNIKALLDKSLEEVDRRKRSDLFTKIDDEVLRQVALIPIHYSDRPYLTVRSDVKGLVIPIYGEFLLKFKNVTISEENK